MANLYIMCGVPGSGKSTFLKKYIKKENAVVVSRDEIRFSLVRPDEDYFSHEFEVYQRFWDTINLALAANKDVYADQTSLTPKSRQFILSHIEGYNKAYIIYIKTNMETCLKRNETRKGTRAYVPKGTIRRMAAQLIEPSLSIDNGFFKVFTIKGE